ncbi:hypothetical protein [Aquimarina algiphila]|uniref:hypothetical protein n=1 Tax=Aquimarina algiphila TaxID=2047982 RepID=UPI00232F878D|nr:hypothetical protein [Aquimarina algiphila]
MSVKSSLLYNTKAYKVVLTAPNAPSITLKVVDNEYYEYKGQIETKKYMCTDADTALILLELKIEKLQHKAYTCEKPLYTPNIAINLENTFPLNAEELFNQEQLDFEQVDYTILGDKLFIKFEDLDIVALYDCLKPSCEQSKIPELQIDYKKLNRIYIALLHKFFYLPMAKQLSGIWLTCGFDSLPYIIDILHNANALSVPILLTIHPEYKVLYANKSIEKINMMKHVNLQELQCEVKYIEEFSLSLNFLQSLCVYDSFTTPKALTKKSETILEVLRKHEFGQLTHLTINNTEVEDGYLQKLLKLPLISKLSYLCLSGGHSNFPFKILKNNIEKWEHLETLIINKHNAPKEILEEFKLWPQVIFKD